MARVQPYHGTYASARSASEVLDLDAILAGCDAVDEKAQKITEYTNNIQASTSVLDQKNFSINKETPQQEITDTCTGIEDVQSSITETTSAIREAAEAAYNEIQAQFNYEAEQKDAYEKSKIQS